MSAPLASAVVNQQLRVLVTFAPRPLRYDRGRALNAVRSFGVSTEIRPCNGSATTAKQCVPSPPLSASSAEYQPTVDDTPIKEETCPTTEGNSQEPQDSSVVALGHSPTSPGPSPLFDPEATNAEDREHQDSCDNEIVVVGAVSNTALEDTSTVAELLARVRPKKRNQAHSPAPCAEYQPTVDDPPIKEETSHPSQNTE